jgi:transcriptional regulator with XRE-family HTH domain
MGRLLQNERKKAEMSQSELAKKARVPVATLQSWERGKREPLFGSMVRIAVALGISLDVLAGIEPKTTPPAE